MKNNAPIATTLTEVTLLNVKNECLHLERREKDRFIYPLHKHKELELNFVCGSEGLTRIVGDSIEEISDSMDLALIGSGLEHEWAESKSFVPHKMHEITIHLSTNLLGEELLSNQYMNSIRLLMQRAQRGISYSLPAIERIKPKLEVLSETAPSFQRFMLLMDLLYTLANEDYKMLASEEFSNSNIPTDNQRILLATEYINKHFMEDIHLADLANLVCMTPTAFSSFFSLRTHKSVSDYIIDQRLGYAARQLIDSTQPVIEICYDCGFNNVSNFNRLFKKRKGYTPTEYRKNYNASKVIAPTDPDSQVKLVKE